MYFGHGDSLSAASAQMKKKMNIMQNFKDDGIWVGSDRSCNEMAPADAFSIEHPSLPGDIYWCLTDSHHCYGGWMVTTTMPQRRIFPLFAVNRSSLCENFSDYHFNGIGYAHVLQNVFSGMILM